MAEQGRQARQSLEEPPALLLLQERRNSACLQQQLEASELRCRLEEDARRDAESTVEGVAEKERQARQTLSSSLRSCCKSDDVKLQNSAVDRKNDAKQK